MSRHRAEVRPRYGRIAVAGASLSVTLIAVLGGTGLLPLPSSAQPPSGGSALQDASYPAPSADSAEPSHEPSELAEDSAVVDDEAAADAAKLARKAERARARAAEEETALPADSGEGRRAVFSESRQRVWLIEDDGTVERTYLVSGSLYDNLDPGTYSVYSRSDRAWGVDGSTMSWFVRFAHGPNAAIGFHDIPELGGAPVQTFAQLGTPLSHGCVRQRERDALAMWDFAQLGTTVVVTA
ncbi:MAG: L,D-transpeptidase [Nocardioidaceae bacterium]|nr:L,D-transpeptidase [Nocardioidaceae bacterium]